MRSIWKSFRMNIAGNIQRETKPSGDRVFFGLQPSYDERFH